MVENYLGTREKEFLLEVETLWKKQGEFDPGQVFLVQVIAGPEDVQKYVDDLAIDAGDPAKSDVPATGQNGCADGLEGCVDAPGG